MLLRPSGTYIKEIKDSNGNLIAIHFNVFNISEEGIWIPTPSAWGLQVGVFKHGKGYRVSAHLHPRERYGKHLGCEILFVIEGELKVKLFDKKENNIDEIIISKGDCLAMTCAHSVEVLEEALVLGVKEGPYPGKELDKVWLRRLT